MSAFNPQALFETLTRSLPTGFGGRFCVAFSGGLDSTALLFALTELARDQSVWRIRAVHIDHQLQAGSNAWAEHCRGIALQCGVQFEMRRINVLRVGELGLEAAARTARYDALREIITEGEALLTAHHADDQVETVLLALTRGAGVQGLSAMPRAKPFGLGWHLRPLLSFDRGALQAWVDEHGVEYIEDPTNARAEQDRNFLRHEIIPLLTKRWPSLTKNVARSVQHFQEAAALLSDIARHDLVDCGSGDCLRLESLRNLSPARCRNVLRTWIRLHGFKAPSTRRLEGLMHDLFASSADRIPLVRWADAEIRWHRGYVYLTHSMPPDSAFEEFDAAWDWSREIALPASIGRLSAVPTVDQGFAIARLPPSLSVRFRRGGEKIRLAGRAHRSALRNLLQENDVLPWWRDKLPLIFAGKQLLAIGDLIFADEFSAAPGEAAVRFVWRDQPAWKACQETS